MPNIVSNVLITTKDLEGPGYIQAFTPQGRWEQVFYSPNGTFTFNQPVPGFAWHCDGTLDNCVAVLKVGDSKGAFDTPKSGRIYVCTEGYRQSMGRKHCGERGLQDLLGERPTVPLPPTKTGIHFEASEGTLRSGTLNPMTYRWFGDPWSRIFAGTQWFPETDSYDPASESRYPEPTSEWSEIPYYSDALPKPVVGGELIGSVDLGACSIFIPWEWENRIQTDLYTPLIGAQTENRGLAEIMLDGIIDNAEPVYSFVRNVALYMDAASYVRPRTDVSPEFHVRVGEAGDNVADVTEGAAEMQICLKNYFMASSDLNTGIDDWYRWDQGIWSAFASLFGIGDCNANKLSTFYCGGIDIDPATRQGRFRLADDVHVAMEGYSVFKPKCNNEFIPKLKEGIEKGFVPWASRTFRTASTISCSACSPTSGSPFAA